ncbi:aquaporin-like protein [Aspergillus unguis]
MARGNKKTDDRNDADSPSEESDSDSASEPDSSETLSDISTESTGRSRRTRSRDEFFSLAGQTHSQREREGYVAPEYMKYNPHYREQREQPVFSLAHPFPRIVRDGMRPPDERKRKHKKHGKRRKGSRGEKQESEAQAQGGRQNANAGRQSAAAEPPNTETTEERNDGEGEGEGEMQHADSQQQAARDEPPTAHPSNAEQDEGKAQAEQMTSDNREYFNYWGRIRDVMHKELAEWLGVTVAMTIGLCAGFSTYTSDSQAGTFPTLAASWGFGFMIAIYVSGNVSGGHLNPMISIALAVWRGFPARRLPTYVAAQVMGAVTAAGIAYLLYHDAIVNLATQTHVTQSQTAAKQALVTLPKEFIHPPTAFFVEFIGSAMLMAVIMALGDDANAPPGAGMQAFIIGVFISILILALGYTSGGCFNPARDFGGRVIGAMAGWGGDLFTEYHAWWIWGPWIADISGGLFGGFMYDFIIFTGGESPVNYPLRRHKRVFFLRNRNARNMLHLGRGKVPDLERAADDNA